MDSNNKQKYHTNTLIVKLSVIMTLYYNHTNKIIIYIKLVPIMMYLLILNNRRSVCEDLRVYWLFFPCGL